MEITFNKREEGISDWMVYDIYIDGQESPYFIIRTIRENDGMVLSNGDIVDSTWILDSEEFDNDFDVWLETTKLTEAQAKATEWIIENT